MLVTEGRRKSVAYLSVYQYDDRGRRDLSPQGTVFFVGVDGGCRSTFVYAVTARHCVEDRDRDDELVIEVPTESGEPILTFAPEWHRSQASDVACRLVTERPSCRLIHFHEFADDSEMAGLLAGQGVYTVGLFNRFPYGVEEQRSTEPIVRFGTICRPPCLAPVHLNPRDYGDWKKAVLVDAVLIESISFGGESGSPVFLYPPETIHHLGRMDEGRWGRRRPATIQEAQVRTPLLGLISSHWGVPETIKGRNGERALGDVDLNSGIAVVIPVTSVKELLMSEPVTLERDEIPPKAPQPAKPLSDQKKS